MLAPRTLRRDALAGKLLEDEDEEDDLVVGGEEDATFARPARTKEAPAGPDGELTGQISIGCDAPEHLIQNGRMF